MGLSELPVSFASGLPDWFPQEGREGLKEGRRAADGKCAASLSPIRRPFSSPHISRWFQLLTYFTGPNPAPLYPIKVQCSQAALPPLSSPVLAVWTLPSHLPSPNCVNPLLSKLLSSGSAGTTELPNFSSEGSFSLPSSIQLCGIPPLRPQSHFYRASIEVAQVLFSQPIPSPQRTLQPCRKLSWNV